MDHSARTQPSDLATALLSRRRRLLRMAPALALAAGPTVLRLLLVPVPVLLALMWRPLSNHTQSATTAPV